ncbi:MAG: hypothetical protein AB7V50_01115 [Vampirovibrionia bacterium]
MNEEHFLASLKCLNTNSLEDFYEKSLAPEKRLSFQMTLFKMIIRNYSIVMVCYAFLMTCLLNVLAFFVPSIKKSLPDILLNSLPSKSWYRGIDNNSSVVAVIKAVQARYGFEIFKNITRNLTGGYNVVLKDGVILSITLEEFDLVKSKAQFIGKDTKEKEMAYIAYAVMAKNALQVGDFTSFKSAFSYFNSGSSPEYCAEMLGYAQSMMNTEPMRGLNDIVIAYSKTFAVCINNGFIEGQNQKLVFAGHDSMGNHLDKAIIII